MAPPAVAGAATALELDPSVELAVVSWNIHKHQHGSIEEELKALVALERPDFLLLQEARAGEVVPSGMFGHHALSFRSGVLDRNREGVMTLGLTPAHRAQRVRSERREFFILTPKAALISFYPVTGGGELCVVNLHGLNFDPAGVQLAHQLDALRERLAGFVGAMVVAGDFNTWSHSRMKVVNGFTESLDLVEVKPDEEGGKTGALPPGIIGRVFGFAPDLWLDRIFVRGFVPVSVAWMPEYEASDHVPLIARLRWA